VLRDAPAISGAYFGRDTLAASSLFFQEMIQTPVAFALSGLVQSISLSFDGRSSETRALSLAGHPGRA
jgi:hypothetical protein